MDYKEKRQSYYRENKEWILMRQKEYYLKNKQKVLNYQHTYYEKNRDKLLVKGKELRATPEYKKRQKIAHENYRRRNRYKIKSRSIFTYALKKGEIKSQPCEICGSVKNIHGHHKDYTKPLEVNWLCRIHHYNIRSNMVYMR